MNRHDLTQTTRELLNAAVALDICDVVTVACAVANHGTDEGAILAELDECAEACAGCDAPKRTAWIQLRDAVRYLQNPPAVSDSAIAQRFAEEAKTDAKVIMHRHGIRSLTR